MAKIEASPSASATSEQTAPQAAVVAPPWSNPEQAPAAAPAAAQQVATLVESVVAVVVAKTAPEAGDVNVQDTIAQAKPESIADIEAQLSDAKAHLARGQAEKAVFDRALKEAVEEVDRLTLALEELQPRPSVTDTIQAYHASQRRLLDQRAEKLTALRQVGVDWKSLLQVKAPIDAAMARKTARGGQRPTTL